jgi:flagellar basal body-associated protein FliL
VRFSGKFKSIEEWAAVSPERERLLIILILAALGVLVLVAVGITALIMSPGSTTN